MPDFKEYERLRERYRSLDDETLLDMIRYQREDFTPEAQSLIRDELKSRGYRNEDFAGSESEPAGKSVEQSDEEPEGRLVPIARCPDEFVANQALDLLAEHGIPAGTLEGSVPIGVLGGQLPWSGRRSTIVVAARDIGRAKDLLAEFPPLGERLETVLDPDDERDSQ
jgi:hypothetical protein